MEALTSPEPWNLVASDYDEVIVPLFEEFSRRAVELLSLPASARVLDVACGPGTATRLLAGAGHRVDAIDFAQKMIDTLRTRISCEGVAGSFDAQLMDGQALGFEDASFDGALSMFGLMFFPERSRGFSELHRVLKPGARACVSSWFPMTEVAAMKWAFGAFGAIAPPPEDAPPRQPILEDPKTFQQEMEDAGFHDVTVLAHKAPMPVDDVQAFWDGMVRSSAPIAQFKQQVGEERWPELNARALKHLDETEPEDPGSLTLDAWLAVGEKR